LIDLGCLQVSTIHAAATGATGTVQH